MGKNIEVWMHLEVDSGSDGFFITPRTSEYVKMRLNDISNIIKITGPFKVTQIVNNFIPMGDIIGNPCEYLKWNNYTHFLVDWAISHKNLSFSGMNPPSFDEWKNNEDNRDDAGTEDLSSEDSSDNGKDISSDDVCEPTRQHHPISESQDEIDSCCINRTEVAERLKTAREKVGITKSVLAARTGLSEPIIECYESGNEFMDPYDVPCISDELGISVRYLLFGDKTPKYSPVFFDYPMDFPRLMQGPQHKVLKFIDNIRRLVPNDIRRLDGTGHIETLDGINNIVVTDNVASFSVIRRYANTWRWMNESQYLGEAEVIMALNQYLRSPRMKAISTPEIIPYIS